MKELPWDRLSTTDGEGNRIYLYPSDVRGPWQKRRTFLSVGLIFLFLCLPWIRVGSHQALLLDIVNRRFAVFGLTLWAHDAPLLFFLLGGAVLSIAFVTAVWGRVWCGWACPQTVFVEQVFRRIERWIEGDSVTRRRLDESPLSFAKFTKKFFKWTVFSALSLILSHSFLAYFIGTERLGAMMATSPLQNPISFSVMIGIAGFILFDFGWFREQFCTIVCPYGRFQSVLMDDQSSVVAYDVRRGEPRKGTETPERAQGDCINCYRCVQVCPTGIDIRRGVQLECIACTACIDACDLVMERIKKPMGLIRYGNQLLAEGRQEASEEKVPWYKRSRSLIYLSLLTVCILALGYTISHRALIELTLIRAVDVPYQEIPVSDGETQILNHFKADLRNQTFEAQNVTFSVDPDLQQKGVKIVVSNHKSVLAPGEPERADVFVQFPKSLLNFGRGEIPIKIEARTNENSPSVSFTQEAHLVGPLR